MCRHEFESVSCLLVTCSLYCVTHNAPKRLENKAIPILIFAGLGLQVTGTNLPRRIEHTLRDPNEKPYAHPYYWVSFVFYGV